MYFSYIFPTYIYSVSLTPRFPDRPLALLSSLFIRRTTLPWLAPGRSVGQSGLLDVDSLSGGHKRATQPQIWAPCRSLANHRSAHVIVPSSNDRRLSRQQVGRQSTTDDYYPQDSGYPASNIFLQDLLNLFSYFLCLSIF